MHVNQGIPGRLYRSNRLYTKVIHILVPHHVNIQFTNNNHCVPNHSPCLLVWAVVFQKMAFVD